MIAIKEIAKLAKVSRGTVDRVIHDRGNYSEKTEKKGDRRLVRQTDCVDHRHQCVDQELEDTRDLAQPDQSACNDKQRKYLFEIPDHPRICLYDHIT